mmetsp:Transcript_47129/g.119286  ORF Transcript_47129/g.119286 Transcript_47129/m.119286 type:complete len:282 (+) Transcript_47129:253-1098(+)
MPVSPLVAITRRPWMSCTVAVAAAVLLRRAWKLLGPTRPNAAASEQRLSRWVEMWGVGRTHFHQKDVNPILLRYKHELLGAGDGSLRVLVPLCGKTVDLIWLAQNADVGQVVGNEAVGKAIEEFSQENPSVRLDPMPETDTELFKHFVGYGGRLMLLQGDHFFLSQKEAGGAFDSIWDRASLIAINPGDRKKYVQVLDSLLKPGGKVLLATLDRAAGDAQALAKGPPFSVPEAEVLTLFHASKFDVRKLQSQELINDPGHARFKDAGLTSLVEEVYIISKR